MFPFPLINEIQLVLIGSYYSVETVKELRGLLHLSMGPLDTKMLAPLVKFGTSLKLKLLRKVKQAHNMTV